MLDFHYITEEEGKIFLDALLHDSVASRQMGLFGNAKSIFGSNVNQACFSFYDNEKLVGFFKVSQADSTGFNYFDYLYVLKKERRKGYATDMLRLGIDYSYRNWQAKGIDVFTIQNKIMDKIFKKSNFQLGSYDRRRYWKQNKFWSQKRWFYIYI